MARRLGWGRGLPAPHPTAPHHTTGLSAPPPGWEERRGPGGEGGARERSHQRSHLHNPPRSALPGQPGASPPPPPQAVARPRVRSAPTSPRRRNPFSFFPGPLSCQLPAETSCLAPDTKECPFPPLAYAPGTGVGDVMGLHASPQLFPGWRDARRSSKPAHESRHFDCSTVHAK